MTIISSYTTAEAVADGVLMRVQPDASEEAGIVYPVYMTSAVWERYVKVLEGIDAEQDLPAAIGNPVDISDHCTKFIRITDEISVHLPFSKPARPAHKKLLEKYKNPKYKAPQGLILDEIIKKYNHREANEGA